MLAWDSSSLLRINLKPVSGSWRSLIDWLFVAGRFIYWQLQHCAHVCTNTSHWTRPILYYTLFKGSRVGCPMRCTLWVPFRVRRMQRFAFSHCSQSAVPIHDIPISIYETGSSLYSLDLCRPSPSRRPDREKNHVTRPRLTSPCEQTVIRTMWETCLNIMQ